MFNLIINKEKLVKLYKQKQGVITQIVDCDENKYPKEFLQLCVKLNIITSHITYIETCGKKGGIEDANY